ncbi:hypothetical protein [Aestuariicoccus sp. MJ-SS9]|uniref:hypothetical protein n=1 Tax=Aestuariicoccus sp. MJ-SS9 TaxID=3079855 RepID=UPI00290D4615|nr:hypothetical protein [Aestuariicoccus sp. MJ-SS9]MDU8912888.1 hypothetical protein [Aestuariicoccus sp. MJ-SS9]
MLDILLLILTIAIQGGGGGATSTASVAVPQTAPALVAEPQVPTGQFTTAVEIKPILTMTQSNWVAVRDFNGQDLVYFSHLLSWRCGLLRLRWGVNDGPLQDWPLPPCYEGTNAPNAIKTEDGLPYVAQPAGSVQSVTIEITYDDLEVQTARFERAQILMP